MTHHPERDRARGADASLAAWLRVAWGTAAVALVVAAFLLWQTSTLRGQLDDVNRLLSATAQNTDSMRAEMTALKSEIAEYRAAPRLGEPDLRFVSLAGVHPNRQAFGIVATRPDRSTGVLYVYRFPVAREDEEYQLWGLREARPPIGLGTFTADKNGAATLYLETIPAGEEIVGFSVTIEPRGGMAEPTGTLCVRGMDPMEQSGRNRVDENR